MGRLPLKPSCAPRARPVIILLVMIFVAAVPGLPALAQEETGGAEDQPGLRGLFSFRTLGNQFFSPLSVSGYLRNETAFRIKEPSAFTKMLNILVLDPQYRFSRSVRLAGRIRAYYDNVYDLEDIDTISPRKGPTAVLGDPLDASQVESLDPGNVRNVEFNQQDVELRELYLDVHLAQADLRLGKQIVRWGVVEGSRVTDEINPLDLSEFIFRDVVDRYIPLWMAKATFFMGTTDLELIWIPDLKFHQPAPRGSEWEQFRFLAGLERPDPPLENPIRNFRNSELAIRLLRPVKGWDLSLSYFYTWDDFPAAFRSIGLGPVFAATPQTEVVNFQPRYERLHIIGSTASTSFGRLVLNAEAAYVIGKIFGARLGTLTGAPDPNTPTLGEITKNYVKYAVGLDFALFGTSFSFQLLRQEILGYEPFIIQDKIDTIYGLFLRRQFLSNRLTAEKLTLYFVNDDEWLIRPKLSYSMTDQVKLSFGADLLIGTIADAGPDGILLPGEFHFVGFFKNNSRIYTEIQYSF